MLKKKIKSYDDQFYSYQLMYIIVFVQLVICILRDSVFFGIKSLIPKIGAYGTANFREVVNFIVYTSALLKNIK